MQEEDRQADEAEKWKSEPNTSGMTFGHYLTDMVTGVRNLHCVGTLLVIGMFGLLIGYLLMIWGVLTPPTPPVPRSLPSQLERVSDKIECWNRTIPAEPDAISRANTSDIEGKLENG
jgi:hypothetical protein